MPKTKSGLLWQLQLDSVARPSFLFGTMHVQDQRAFQLQDRLRNLILQCDTFAGEVNLHDLRENPPHPAVLPPEQFLSQVIRPKKWAKIRRISQKSFGLDLDHLQHLPPLFITQALTEQLLQKDHPLSLDAWLMQFADQNGIPVIGLETPQSQLALLQKIPYDQQLDSLLSNLRQVRKFRRHFQELTQAYQEENLRKLYKATYQSLGKLRRGMLFDRNRYMAERIRSEIQDKSLFAAVGAAHLPGGKGILRLLKHGGVKIRPL